MNTFIVVSKEPGPLQAEDRVEDTRTINFREISDIEDPLLPALLDAYETSFPANEREPVSHILQALLARKRGAPVNRHLLIAERDSDMIAMACYDLFDERHLAYLVYMAVANPTMRGAGIGTALFAEITRRLAREQHPISAILLEVDDPSKYATDPDEKHIAERRLTFYRRLGVAVLRGVRYIQTVPFYPEGTPMLIGVRPLAPVTPQWVLDRAIELFGSDVEQLGPLALSG